MSSGNASQSAAAAAAVAVEELRKSVTHEILDTFRSVLESCAFVNEFGMVDLFRQTDALTIFNEAVVQCKDLLACHCVEATCHHPTRPDSEERLVQLREEWGNRIRRQLEAQPGYSHDTRNERALLIPYLYTADPHDDRVFEVDENNPEYVAARAERPEVPAGGVVAYRMRLQYFMRCVEAGGVPDAYFDSSSDSSESSWRSGSLPPFFDDVLVEEVIEEEEEEELQHEEDEELPHEEA
jgi:hypothetical protein